MLAKLQRRFITEIAEGDDGPASSSRGMAIYRNAYRARLADALATSFERTQYWVGDELFSAASAHYILTQPPVSWTLDAYGAQFPAALAKLFGEDPEVAELAWLEWHMQQAFAARDIGALTAADLAQAGLAESDWEDLRLVPAAGFACRPITHDIASLWHGLSGTADDLPPKPNVDEAVLLIWRKDFSPQFRQIGPAEWAALDPMLRGESFGAVAAAAGDEGIAQFGQWFAQWLGEGLFSTIRLPS